MSSLGHGNANAKENAKSTEDSSALSTSITSSLEQVLSKFAASLEQQVVTKVEASLSKIVRQACLEGTSEALQQIPQQDVRLGLQRRHLEGNADESTKYEGKSDESLGVSTTGGNKDEDNETARAATKIQAIQRGKAARKDQEQRVNAVKHIQAIVREKAKKKLNFASTARAVIRRKGRMEDVFWETADSCGRPDLNEMAFVSAIRRACPRIYKAQAQALFKGYCEATEKRRIDARIFVAFGQAIEEGDASAAEYADISVDDYQDLAVSEDIAARRIQAQAAARKQRKDEAKGQQ
jgi:hypothetical protein